MRAKLLGIEQALYAVIDRAQKARENAPAGNAGNLCMDIELECHEMIKRISQLTEGELKKVIPVDFRTNREGTT
jgi:hypothetical protein